MFLNIYKDKKVLVTGHTGFKGTWLITWLLNLGAKIVGISKDIPTKPSMFEELKLEAKINHYQENIADLSKIKKIILNEQPEFLFHLAAQPIVLNSYIDPIDTIISNVMGTSNVLESLRVSNNNCTAVIITSDKAYDNIEQVWGYKENDRLGGKDIYSGSKSAAESIIQSYYNSFFKSPESRVRLAVARAGNVIGGGDWAKDRIVVDCIVSWSKKKKVKIRNPDATRPWQHVLEPLSGYLNLGKELYLNKTLSGESFNFGPISEQNYTVKKLLKDLATYWDFENINDTFSLSNSIPFHEARLLKLNCDKSMHFLNWQANMRFEQTVKFTSEWYYDFYNTNKSIFDKTMSQISEYELMAKKKGLAWTE
jgi:CDP-glucose 4,6-dehydratase